MKKLMAFIFFCFAVSFLSAQQSDFEWIKEIRNMKAKVSSLENGETFVMIPENNSSGRFISQQLPDEYKKDGLCVMFTGWEGKIPPNARMLGTPLKLKSICVSREEQKKFALKKRKYNFK